MDDATKKLIHELLTEKEMLIKRYPHLREFQHEIDSVLKKIGNNPVKRAHALNKMMLRQLQNKLIPALSTLKQKLEELSRTVTDRKEKASIIEFHLKKVKGFYP